MPTRKLFARVLAVLLVCCTTASAADKVLLHKKSAFNTIVVTEDEKGLRTLWFEVDGARQSVVKPGDPDYIELQYARAMPVGLACMKQPRRVLMVGLGGGTIPSFLHRHFPQLQIDVVDIDPEVVAVAKQFFGFRETQMLRAYVDDGRRFIARNPGRYDIIFLDAFSSDNIPYHLATQEFLQSVRRGLRPNGIVVANVWGRYSNPLYDSMVRTYQDVFDELYVLDVRLADNKILFGSVGKKNLTRDAVALRASEISRVHRFRFDMGRVVSYGFGSAEREAVGGRVLTDANRPRPAEEKESAAAGTLPR